MYSNVEIRGAHFRGQHAVEYLAACQPGDELGLEREPENPYDSYAIKVLSQGDGLHIGYVAKEAAAWIAPEMDEKPEVAWVATYAAMDESGRNPKHYCNIEKVEVDDAGSEEFED